MNDTDMTFYCRPFFVSRFFELSLLHEVDVLALQSPVASKVTRISSAIVSPYIIDDHDLTRPTGLSDSLTYIA